MSKYIDADLLRKEIERQRQFIEELFTEGDNSFYDGQDDAYCYILAFLAFLDSIQEQPVEGLEEEIATWIPTHISGGDDEVWRDTKNAVTEWAGIVARHFAEWGARHSINWGDVQLLDTFILELSREEKDGADWGDSEKFYTEVLRRFHEFNDKKIPEIVAKWEAEHLKR